MATVAREILDSAVKRSQESAMRFLRFDTEAWAALVADRLRQSEHELSSEDLAEIRRRVGQSCSLSPQLLPAARGAVRAVGRQQTPSIGQISWQTHLAGFSGFPSP
jgi:hypothetical protein